MYLTIASFVILSIIFGASSVLYRNEKKEKARYLSLLGFGSLFFICIILTIVLAMQDRFDVWFIGVNLGIYFMFNAFVKAFYREEITQRLTETIALFIVMLAPFYIIPNINNILMELMAENVHVYSNLLGLDTELIKRKSGLRTKIIFGNGGYLFVNWACVGVEFAVLYSALILSSDISIRKKIGGFFASFLVVYSANILRMMFTTTVMEKDLIGPMFTDGNTIQMSYFIAENIISQTFIVLVAVGVFMAVMRLVPNTEDVIDGFLDQHERVDEWYDKMV